MGTFDQWFIKGLAEGFGFLCVGLIVLVSLWVFSSLQKK